MNIVILDDYQDAVRNLLCARKLEAWPAKVYTNTVKGLGQLSLRLRDADVVVLIRERTQLNRALIEKLPRLKLISQTGKVGPHIDLAACHDHGVAVAEGVGSPHAAAELTWALVMAAARRLPQYISNLKHGVWQQSGLKAHPMPKNFGLGTALRGRTLGIWGYGRIGQLVASYGRAFGMNVLVWGREGSMERAAADGLQPAPSRAELFARSDVLSVHLRLNDGHARNHHAGRPVAHEALRRCSSTPQGPNWFRPTRCSPRSAAASRAWPRSTCSRASRSCRATRCCGWRTASARRISATSSRTATSCISTRHSTTS